MPRALLDRAAIGLTYWWRHGRLPRLDAPMLFTERVQHRKLHDRDARLPHLADKVAVKAWVRQRLGPHCVTPTLWQGTALPEAPVWPMPFVVKARHGCNQYRFVRSAADWREARRAARRWMRARYGWWLSEWAYGAIPRGLLVEPFIGDGDAPPVDYKLFVFGGRVQSVQVHLDRAGRHRWIVFDRAWRRVSSPTADPDPSPPAALHRMIWAAERLAAGFAFVRVDLYDGPAGPLFGEMTFYPGSGLHRVDPSSLDAQWGAAWGAAIERASDDALAA